MGGKLSRDFVGAKVVGATVIGAPVGYNIFKADMFGKMPVSTKHVDTLKIYNSQV